MRNKLLVITGPTATGKTELALKLAKKFGGELVACDSRQVYRGLDIGTGKKPDGKWKMEDGGWKKGRGYWEINKTKIWMYDKVPLNKQYTVADYVKDAEKIVKDIVRRNKLPILVGGTGFYLDAFINGLPNLSVPVNKKLREGLADLSLEQLQNKLKQISPKRWQKMNNSDRQNPRRLLRSIELILMYGYMNEIKNSKFKIQNYNILKIGLTAPRQVLYEKINRRVLDWLKEGLIDEVRGLLEQVGYERLVQLGLEYSLVAQFLEGKMKDEQQLVELIQGKIRGYARRQQTWFKKDKEIVWFDTTSVDYEARIEKQVIGWYNQQ